MEKRNNYIYIYKKYMVKASDREKKGGNLKKIFKREKERTVEREIKSLITIYNPSKERRRDGKREIERDRDKC